MTCLVLLCMLFPLLQSISTVRYDGHKVLRINIRSTEQLDVMQSLQSNVKYDFWREPVAIDLPVDIQVAPADQEEIQQTLTEHGIHYRVMIDDVQRLISKQLSRPSRPSTRELEWDQYYSLQEIYDWMEDVADRCGDDCETFTVGTSYEGREIKGIKVTRPGNNCAVYIDGAVHAREWITPAMATYFISRVIFDYGTDETTTDLRDHFDFYIQPIVNVDGYDYSWTTDRMWRKTRSPNEGSTCRGTDGNRNYNHNWETGLGQSTDPCSQTYRGTGPLSEAETSAMNDFLLPIRDPFISFFSMHSYGEFIITPWGYTVDESPEDLPDIFDSCEAFVTAANPLYGKDYYYRESGGISGCTIDWAKGEMLMKYSVLLESRDDGTHGFLLPPEQILPTSEETWAGLQAMYLNIMAREGDNCSPTTKLSQLNSAIKL